MSYTTGTTHYNLPLTTSNDKRDWTDTNQAFTDVDAALYDAVSNTSTQGEEITALDTRLTTAEGNISTNSGNITALDTRLTTAEGNITSQGTQIADVRSDAEDMICAYNEATATSTHAYSIGAYFIYNDVLYRATADIGVGDTIVPDTNCTTTNVTTELATAGGYAVDMICLTVENTTTSTHNYSSGDYFLLNKTLYKATATITVGTTIIPNTNCISTNVSTELTALNARLTQNTIGSPITLSTDELTAPSDGYAVATVGYASGELVYVDVNDAHLLQVVSGGASSTAGFQVSSVFVKKGMRLKVRQINGSEAHAYFYPLS